jgi:predicted ferric reductase
VKKIKLCLWTVLIGLTLLWLVTEDLPTAPLTFASLHSALLFYSGTLAIGTMSVAMLLALRPLSLEPCLGGLDKMYRLQQWLGISACLFALIHWLTVQAPGWLLALGWIARPARHGQAAAPDGAVFQFFQDQRGLAESLGEWAFYAAVVLIVLTLSKRFPYRYFPITQRLLAAVYLALVFHALMLMKLRYWTAGLGPLLALLMLAGSLAALIILLRRAAAARRVVGVVESSSCHSARQVLDIALRIEGRWRGHRSGQFAFITFDAREGAHPFTITSDWNNDGFMHLTLKGLGDYTRTLPERLQADDPVKVEGPFGQFNFISNKPRQIWVAGGIGITPFMARMQHLTRTADGKNIDLFYSPTQPDEALIKELRLQAQAAKIQLHVRVDARDGPLSAERICQAVPKWRLSDIWFCGPAGFAHLLRGEFRARGIPGDDFHQELFDLRG